MKLRLDRHWDKGFSVDHAVSRLVTDGKRIYLKDQKGFLELMENGGQREFSFVVDMAGIRSDVYTGIKSARIAKSRK
jgi:hypothetical protein